MKTMNNIKQMQEYARAHSMIQTDFVEKLFSFPLPGLTMLSYQLHQFS
jgi:hypothetical protein